MGHKKRNSSIESHPWMKEKEKEVGGGRREVGVIRPVMTWSKHEVQSEKRLQSAEEGEKGKKCPHMSFSNKKEGGKMLK